MNKSILDIKGSGYCISNKNNEWYEALNKLLTDDDLRNCFGVNGRWVVENYYSSDVYAELYSKVIKSICDREEK